LVFGISWQRLRDAVINESLFRLLGDPPRQVACCISHAVASALRCDGTFQNKREKKNA
jgi:hypothetical protein